MKRADIAWSPVRDKHGTITDHVWRPAYSGSPAQRKSNRGLCGYMSCLRPISEHAKATGSWSALEERRQ